MNLNQTTGFTTINFANSRIGGTYCFQARLFGIKFSLPTLIRRSLPTTFCYDRDYEKVSGRIKQQFHETTYFGTLCRVLRHNMLHYG